MTGPASLRKPLTDLLQEIEAQNTTVAGAHAKALIADLDSPPPQAAGKPGDAPVRFTGLYSAILREVRNGERHIGAGNWAAAAKSVKDAMSMLPDAR